MPAAQAKPAKTDTEWLSTGKDLLPEMKQLKDLVEAIIEKAAVTPEERSKLLQELKAQERTIRKLDAQVKGDTIQPNALTAAFAKLEKHGNPGTKELRNFAYAASSVLMLAMNAKNNPLTM